MKNIPRGAIILGLSALTGVVLFKERTGTGCNEYFVCNKCKKVSACTLQEALDYRQAHPVTNQLNK